MVTENNWNSNVDVAFKDHNYCIQTKAAAKECVIYYICGYLYKQIQKHTNCKVCLNALKGSFMFYFTYYLFLVKHICYLLILNSRK
jgi:hypothetical protein